jgi:hypothetical protein
VERAKSFFGELLGWEYKTDASGYVSVKNATGSEPAAPNPRKEKSAGPLRGAVDLA